MGGRVKPGIELRISCSDTMLNYRLSQKLKLLGNGEFNHLTISLTKPNIIVPGGCHTTFRYAKRVYIVELMKGDLLVVRRFLK